MFIMSWKWPFFTVKCESRWHRAKVAWLQCQQMFYHCPRPPAPRSAIFHKTCTEQATVLCQEMNLKVTYSYFLHTEEVSSKGECIQHEVCTKTFPSINCVFNNKYCEVLHRNWSWGIVSPRRRGIITWKVISCFLIYFPLKQILWRKLVCFLNWSLLLLIP